MMATVNIDDAKAHLPEIISGLNPGEQLVIVESGKPLATLTRTPSKQWPCKAGSAKETKHWMAPDFDAPLDEFREYME
jgi:antitoxin (DNA-binding transcriptional repressor) of toxin-antitoxin stability system